LQRLLAAAVLAEASRARLVALAEALDPVQALRQLHLLQEALWRHAVASPPATPAPTVRFTLPDAAPAGAAAESGEAVSLRAPRSPAHPERPKRRGAQAQTSATPSDPFAGEADTIDAWLAVQPERPAAERSADGIRTERRQRCQGCGDPFSVFPLERERTSAYCARMQALRARHRTGAG